MSFLFNSLVHRIVSRVSLISSIAVNQLPQPPASQQVGTPLYLMVPIWKTALVYLLQFLPVLPPLLPLRFLLLRFRNLVYLFPPSHQICAHLTFPLHLLAGLFFYLIISCCAIPKVSMFSRLCLLQ